MHYGISIWSMVFLLALKPVCRFVSRLLDSRNHISLRLIILSRVLQVQLVKTMSITGRACGIFLFFEDRNGCGLFPDGRDVARDPDIVIYIFR